MDFRKAGCDPAMDGCCPGATARAIALASEVPTSVLLPETRVKLVDVEHGLGGFGEGITLVFPLGHLLTFFEMGDGKVMIVVENPARFPATAHELEVAVQLRRIFRGDGGFAGH